MQQCLEIAKGETSAFSEWAQVRRATRNCEIIEEGRESQQCLLHWPSYPLDQHFLVLSACV